MRLFAASQAPKIDFVNSLYSQDIVEMANAHIRYISYFYFMKKVTSGDVKCKNLKGILRDLCMLYGLSNLIKDCKSCYESGYFEPGVAYSDMILEAMKQINRTVRPHALNIMESFKMNDHDLCSAIGNSYGDIYEEHFRLAKESRMNHTKAGDAIPDGYIEHVMPILNAKM